MRGECLLSSKKECFDQSYRTKSDDDAQATAADNNVPDADESEASEKKPRKVREWGSVPESAPATLIVAEVSFCEEDTLTLSIEIIQVQKPVIEKEKTKYVVGAMKNKKPYEPGA